MSNDPTIQINDPIDDTVAVTYADDDLSQRAESYRLRVQTDLTRRSRRLTRIVMALCVIMLAFGVVLIVLVNKAQDDTNKARIELTLTQQALVDVSNGLNAVRAQVEALGATPVVPAPDVVIGSGGTGTTGAPGRAPTAEEITAAITAYCANIGSCGGVQGTGGATGEPGLPGAVGIQGEPGTAGASGPPGSQGEPGDPGPIGAQGDQGPQGVVGPQGPAGPTPTTMTCTPSNAADLSQPWTCTVP